MAMTTSERVRRDVVCLPHQYEFVNDMTSPTLVLEGGLGCGKTFTAVVKMIRYAWQYPNVAGLVIEPTNDLIGTIFMATVDEFLPLWGIPYEFRTVWRKRPSVLLLWPNTPRETPIYLRSGDEPKRIVGFKVGWFIVDEADQQKKEVWERAVGRKRDRRVREMGGVLQSCAVYTPEVGFNWTYEKFHLKRTPKMHVIEGVSTAANKFNPKSYLKELIAEHDEHDVERVTSGKRSSRDGLVYRRFNANVNLGKCPIDPWSGNVELWCDFNNSKMVWTWVSLLADGRAYVFDELVLEDTDTDEMAFTASVKAARHFSALMMGVDVETFDSVDPADLPVPPVAAARRITVIGDAAGDHDAGAAGKVSYELIRQRGFEVRHKSSNPLIEDTVQTVNMALADGWLVFDEEKAKYVTRCIRQQPYGKDGKPLKGIGSREKVKAGLDHGADCIRYGTWFHRPVYLRRGNSGR